MTAKEVCTSTPAIAYASMLGGVEIHAVEYGMDDRVVCVSHAWAGRSHHKYHRVKVQHTMSGGSYFVLHGIRVHLDQCIRIGGAQG